MSNTTRVTVSRKSYSIIEGTGDDLYITATSDWTKTLRVILCDRFENRLVEIQEMLDQGEDLAKDSWDDYDSVASYLDLLESSKSTTILYDAWTFSYMWSWVKVVDNLTGSVDFEAFGSEM